MYKKLFLFALIVSITIIGISQVRPKTFTPKKTNFSNNTNSTVTQKKKRCYTAEYINQQLKNNPNFENVAQFENWMQQKIQQRKALVESEGNTEVDITNYVLPIVFHVIHNNEAVGSGANIAQATIYAQVAQLNRDFQNLCGSPHSVASTTGIQFALATQNPSGVALTEPGIDRINRSSKGWTAPPYDASASYWDNTVKANSIWDPTRYVNIWIANLNHATTPLLGIATFPASSTLSGLDNLETNSTAGVTVDYLTVGSTITSPDCGATEQFDMGRTLSHELGHFFGLRHIWGDASTCGAATDYCADTPTQLYENSGKSAHPKPNTCGTLDEMFDNYMDYSDDQVLNTFTRNQVDRIQTVMLNSPRRISLATSTVPKIFPSTGSNAISFSNCMGFMSVSETGNTGTTTRYKDYSIPLAIHSGATGAATLNFTTAAIPLSGGGTFPLAVSGVDYEILTPSLTFVTGDYGKALVIRVWDNAKIDASRGVQIGYTLSGSGLSANSTAQTFNFIINDNDDIYVGNNTINVLNESFTSGTMPNSWNTFNASTYTSSFVVGTSGNAGGTSPNAYVSSSPTTNPPPNTYSASASADGYSILETPLIEGYKYASFGNFSYKYGIRGRTYSSTTGTGHNGWLTFISDDDPNYLLNFYGPNSGNLGFGPYGSSTTFYNTPSIASTYLNNARFYIDFYWSVTNTSTAQSPGFNIDDVVLPATPWGIESAVKTSYTFNTQSGQAHTFRTNDATNKMIARVANQTINVANVVASITEAGNDRPTFLTGTTTYLRSRKVVKVVPATASNASYQITIYLSQAEATAWGSAIANAKLMKINDGVALSGNINTSNAVIASSTSVTDKLSTDGFVAFTATFTGYGQFVIVEQAAILPLQWGRIVATAIDKKIAVNWETSNEINATNFEVEKSIDGREFAKMATVIAKNGTTNDYTIIDEKVKAGIKYYYRIKQLDKDGKYSYSSIVTVVIRAEGTYVNVFPNPVQNVLNIQSSIVNSKENKIEILDIQGKRLYINETNKGNAIINMQNWSKGVYWVSVTTNQKTEVFKVVKN
jgi:zinc-dependent metalloproteinase lipoprotein